MMLYVGRMPHDCIQEKPHCFHHLITLGKRTVLEPNRKRVFPHCTSSAVCLMYSLVRVLSRSDQIVNLVNSLPKVIGPSNSW